MNKIIEQSESDFRKSLLRMSNEEQSSILRLINRELALTQQELKRSQELLEMSKEKCNNLEVYRYEQNIRDTELEVEKLDRKRRICESQTLVTSQPPKITENATPVTHVPSKVKLTNGSSPVHIPPSPPSPIIQNQNDETDIVLSTKKLINNFEQLSTVSSPSSSFSSNQSHGIANFKTSRSASTPSWQQPLNTRDKLQCHTNAVEPNPEPLFAQVKLRKIGLPPDAKEVDQSALPNVVSPRRDFNDKIIQSPTVVLSNNVRHMSTVDVPRSSDVTSKDKFHNSNKEIQVAIQNELKEVKLKKISPNSPPLNCAVEHVNMGKFNFSNERSLSLSNSSFSSMSASKSMPFLNSIASASVSIDRSHGATVGQNQLLIEDNIDVTDFPDFNNQDSCLKNWDPTVLLKKLYTIQRKSEAAPSNKASLTQFASYIDVIHGPNIGRPWQREYISIINGQLNFYQNQASKSATDILDLRYFNVKQSHNDSIEVYDSKGIHSTLRCSRPSDCHQLMSSLESEMSRRSAEIVPHLYEDVKVHNREMVLIIDLGSCSVRAGLLKSEPTLPGLYFPHIAAISKSSEDVVEVGFEAFSPQLADSCDIIRPLKPDTTLEHLAFTSGCVEFTMTKVCTHFGINPRDYVVMLSLPHNVAESTRSKLADLLLMRLNFRGVSMCGESLLALHAYGEPTGVLVDIGCRSEILPVTYGVVQNSAVKRSLFGGHLMQVALGHLLPFELHSITDSLLIRLIIEEACIVASSKEESHSYDKSATVDLRPYNLPSNIQSSLILQGKDRCLPTEGLFNPEIYSIDTCGLAKIIMEAVLHCPMDFRKNLYQSIYLSGAATQLLGLIPRLESELRQIVPNNCDVKVYAAADRAHFSYVGACFVASSETFIDTVVNKRQWEDSRMSSLRKWHF